MGFLLFLFAFIFFNSIVFFHEFGHFITAKLFRVKVEEFALGMGPKVISKKIGETLYSFRCLPVGGFCSLEGEEKYSESKSSFSIKPFWQKVTIISAGCFMNLLVGVVFSSVVFAFCGLPSTSISEFGMNSISQESGLELNDKIISIDKNKTFICRDIMFFLLTNPKENYDVEIIRNNVKMTLKNVRFSHIKDANGKYHYYIDFGVGTIKKTFLNLINYSVLNTYSISRVSIYAILGLFRGKFRISDLVGPIGIADQIRRVAGEGLKIGFGTAILHILEVMTMLTVSIGIFNMVPFPAFDGGRILLLIIEKILNRRFSKKVENAINYTGFCLIILLALVVSYHDVIRLINGFNV
ncbi:MAG: site-2 protease family protein [Candidatus Improbicoccus pseudotrichonymphae]|uniref:Site-2 protease family protein n=1 Tax=Candidatus Improbicoccus pseudotrichonymphae TaxID=3033792 RepID=A0AA48I2Y1_9FIRM|nr:MAG: site-2 protease family protein [Candidatus Improbicoccus pseudotrichonymphae]